MTALLAVDPGIRGCGVAVFRDGLLVQAAYVRSPAREGNRAAECAEAARAVGQWRREQRMDEVAVEWPRVYATQIRRGETKEDPNDLLALAGVDAALALVFAPAPVTSYCPSEWKGQMKKSVCHARGWSRLVEAERRVPLEGPPSLHHNVRDAVCLGLHHLGRLEPRRVIPT